MRRYDFITGEFVEEEVKCELCGEVIDSTQGFKIGYIENEEGEKIKVVMGSCCVGKIRAYSDLSKRNKEAYKSRGQIPEEVLKRLPKAPPPDSKSNGDAGKEVHDFINKIGRSVLKKESQAWIKNVQRKA